MRSYHTCYPNPKSFIGRVILGLPNQRVPPCRTLVGPVLHGVPFHALSGGAGFELGFLVVALPFEGVET